MAVDPDATTITPEGLGLVLLTVSLFYTLPSAIVVIARSTIRIRQGIFGMDDGLMLVGWVSSTACVHSFKSMLMRMVDVVHVRCGYGTQRNVRRHRRPG